MARDHFGSRAVSAPAAPRPSGPYSPVKVAGGVAYCSGQLPLDPATGELANGGISAQTAMVLENLGRALASVAASMADVVHTTVYLHNLGDFDGMNAQYAESFGQFRPARSTIGGVALPKGALVEIDADQSPIAGS